MAPPSVTSTSSQTTTVERLRLAGRLWHCAGAVLFYLLTACGWTWPLASHLKSYLPLGSESSATVPLFNLWVLRWNAVWQQGTAGARYWDAPIFYPTKGALALSEPQPLTGLFFTLLQALSHNPILAYNLLLLGILTLNGCAAAWLIIRLDGQPGPAIMAGLLAQSLPFVGRELGVLQLTVLFPLLLALAALWDFHRQPDWRSGLGLGVWAAVTFLMASQYALMFSLFLLLGGFLLTRRRHLRPWVVAQWLAGAGLAGLLLLPSLPSQIRLTAGYQRGDSTIKRNSAQLVDYRRLDNSVWGDGFAPWLRTAGGSGQRLYPGTGLLLLAGLGLASGLVSRSQRGWAIYCSLGAGLAFLLSLGLNLEIGSWHPYQMLRSFYPGFDQLRSPFRLALFGQLFLLSLAGLGLISLWRLRGRFGQLLAISLIGLSLLELINVPARLYPAQMATVDAPWIRWLQEQPHSVILMLPLAKNGRTPSFEPVTLSMNQAISHGHALVNGYSGFFPDSYRQLTRQLDGFPGEASLAYLQEIGVTYLVIDQNWLTIQTGDQLQKSAQVKQVYEDQNRRIYRLAVSP
jgi:hypothetical protein